jgi:hypothetical protein
MRKKFDVLRTTPRDVMVDASVRSSRVTDDDDDDDDARAHRPRNEWRMRTTAPGVKKHSNFTTVYPYYRDRSQQRAFRARMRAHANARTHEPRRVDHLPGGGSQLVLFTHIIAGHAKRESDRDRHPRHHMVVVVRVDDVVRLFFIYGTCRLGVYLYM